MKIVCGLTTIPSRLKKIYETLGCLLKQTILPDVIYITIPLKSKRGKEFDIKDLDQLDVFIQSEPEGKRIQILRPEKDYGPIMKFLEILTYETDPECNIFIIDDDRFIHPDTIGLFKKKSKVYPNCALSLSGWSVGHFPFFYQFIHSLKRDTRVDWLQGTDGIWIKRKFLERIDLLNYQVLPFENLKNCYEMNDDHWIAYQLERKKIPRIVLAGNATHYFNPLPHRRIDALSTRPGIVQEMFQIIYFNIQNNIYYNDTCFLSSFFFIFSLFLIALVLFVLFWFKPNKMFLYLSFLLIVGGFILLKPHLKDL